MSGPEEVKRKLAAVPLERLHEAEHSQVTTTAARSRPSFGKRLRSRSALTLAAILLLLAGAGVGALLARSTPKEHRSAGLPYVGARAKPERVVSAELDALRKQVEAETAPTRALLAFAHLALDEGQMGKRDFAAAARALEDFLALVPTGDDTVRVRAMLEEARAQANAGRTLEPRR